MEFWGGTCRYDTQAQCWVQSIIVRAAHFGARMLKRRPPGGGGTLNRLKIWLFQGANVDEMDWNFHRTIPAPWPIISTRLHSPGPPALCAIMQNPIYSITQIFLGQAHPVVSIAAPPHIPYISPCHKGWASASFSSSWAKSMVSHDLASCSSWDSCLTTQLGNSTDRIGLHFIPEWTLCTYARGTPGMPHNWCQSKISRGSPLHF